MEESEIESAYRNLKIVGAVGIFIVLGVIGYYISNFKNNSISKIPSDWGSFGDFFGGILNPIISLFSLILLGFISYFVAKESNNESKELNLRGRRMDAYNELTRHLPSFDRVVHRFLDAVSVMNINIQNVKTTENYTAQLDYLFNKISLPIQQIGEYNLYVRTFAVQYEHIFDYDFESKEFIDMKEAVNSISNILRELLIILESSNLKFDNHSQTFEIIGKAIDKMGDVDLNYNKPINKVLTNLQIELKPQAR